MRARGGGLDRRPRARDAAIGDRWPGSLVRSLWRALVTQLRARGTPTSRVIAHASRHRSALVVVVARNAGVCVRAAGVLDRRPRARGAAIGDRWLGSLVRSLWRALVTQLLARVTPRLESSLTYMSSLVARRCRRAACGGLRARGGGLDRRPRARDAAIGDRWPGSLVRSLWRALVTQFARASHARVTNHRARVTSYLVARRCRRAECRGLRARGGGLDRRPRARGAAIADRWPGSLVRSLWRALVTQLQRRVTPASHEPSLTRHVISCRSSLSSRGVQAAKLHFPN